MIRRWLAHQFLRFRIWLFADMVRRLDVIDSRLMTIEQKRGLPVERPAPALPPEPREWGCGHHHFSGVKHHDGRSECVDCHQLQYQETPGWAEQQ